jgi:hypothetical protein
MIPVVGHSFPQVFIQLPQSYEFRSSDGRDDSLLGVYTDSVQNSLHDQALSRHKSLGSHISLGSQENVTTTYGGRQEVDFQEQLRVKDDEIDILIDTLQEAGVLIQSIKLAINSQKIEVELDILDKIRALESKITNIGRQYPKQDLHK